MPMPMQGYVYGACLCRCLCPIRVWGGEGEVLRGRGASLSSGWAGGREGGVCEGGKRGLLVQGGGGSLTWGTV